MKHLFEKKFFSIPSLTGYFRLVMIPVFVWLYLHVVMDADYYKTALVTSISSITDMFDGMVVRKLSMITGFGKFLDLLADKLTHGAILLCLLSRYPLILLLAVFSVAEEGFMLVMGTIKLCQGKRPDGAMWFGKRYTAPLFVVLFFFLLSSHMLIPLVNGPILLCGVVMTATLVMYAWVFRRVQGRP